MSNASSISLGGETAKATLAKFAMAVTGFVGTIVFANILGPAAFGGFYLLFALVKIVDRPITGWGAAAKKRFSEADAPEGEIVGAQLVAFVLVTGLAAFAALLAAGWLRGYTGLATAPLLFVLLLVATGLYEPFDNLVQARGRIGVAFWVDAVRSFLTLPLQLLFVAGFGLGLGAAGMAYGLAGATYLTVPVIVYVVGVRPTIPSSETVRGLWRYARFSIPGAFLGQAYDRFDVLLLGLIVSQAAAGHYEVAAKLTLPAMFVAETAGSGLMARVSNQRSKGMPVGQDVTNTLAFASVLALPIFLGSLALSERLVVGIYGEAFRAAAPLLVGLALYRVVSTQTGPLTQAVNGLDRPDVTFRVSALTLGVNVVLGVGLTLWLDDAVGVVIATVVAETIRYAALAVVVRSELPAFELLPHPIAEQLGSAILMCLAVIGTDSIVQGIPAVIVATVTLPTRLLLLVAVGAAVYFLVLLVVSEQLRTTIGSVLRGSRIEGYVPRRLLRW